ncbi:hypothetical protein CEB3_c08040 [Peptococcaceae bacterium CEB3]|nr:hypothetical protein CEB3_c08040 [Peptococcaceae bacterium CEB3]
MKTLRRKLLVGVLGVCLPMLMASTALAIGDTSFSVSVPGHGNWTNIPALTGTVSHQGYAQVTSSPASSEPFNFSLWTQGGVKLVDWLTLNPGYGYQWSNVPDTNGDNVVFKVGTGVLYGPGTASGDGWF